MHGRTKRGGGSAEAAVPDATDAGEWFGGRLPDDWFADSPDVVVDRDEITVIGTLPGSEGEGESSAAAQGRAARFREETRDRRMVIADEAQARYRRTVSWGVVAGGERIMFTHLAVPVMTRLRQPERRVLDTLVDAGVARSRADALVWSVKLVGTHTDEWLDKLRDAMADVETLRNEGPGL